jgi:hypothetical protein
VLQWVVPRDAYPPGKSQTAGTLAALEAASLVAGVPRSILTCYTGAYQLYEDTLHTSFAATLVYEQVVKVLTGNDMLVKLAESPCAEASLRA